MNKGVRFLEQLVEFATDDSGFALCFVICRDEGQQRRWLRRLNGELECRGRVSTCLSGKVLGGFDFDRSLTTQIKAVLPNDPVVLNFYASEYIFSELILHSEGDLSGRKGKPSVFLRRLNIDRESFVYEFEKPVLIWTTECGRRSFGRNAPDFYDVRELVLVAPGMNHTIVQKLEDRIPAFVLPEASLGLTEFERRELVKLEALEEKRSPDQTRLLIQRIARRNPLESDDIQGWEQRVVRELARFGLKEDLDLDLVRAAQLDARGHYSVSTVVYREIINKYRYQLPWFEKVRLLNVLGNRLAVIGEIEQAVSQYESAKAICDSNMPLGKGLRGRVVLNQVMLSVWLGSESDTGFWESEEFSQEDYRYGLEANSLEILDLCLVIVMDDLFWRKDALLAGIGRNESKALVAALEAEDTFKRRVLLYLLGCRFSEVGDFGFANGVLSLVIEKLGKGPRVYLLYSKVGHSWGMMAAKDGDFQSAQKILKKALGWSEHLSPEPQLEHALKFHLRLVEEFKCILPEELP